jgi:hypothetical protein
MYPDAVCVPGRTSKKRNSTERNRTVALLPQQAERLSQRMSVRLVRQQPTRLRHAPVNPTTIATSCS